MTEGFQAAFSVAIAFALVGALMAFVFLRRGPVADAAPAGSAPAAQVLTLEKAHDHQETVNR